MSNLYGMPIIETWTGRKIIKAENFDKAKCPICHKIMTYEYNMMDIYFMCDNKKCKGYMLRLPGQAKTMLGHIEIL